jgi:molecular chaperone GrpE
MEMTEAEKHEEPTKDVHGKKKHSPRHVDKAKTETDHHEKHRLSEELKASEEKVKEFQDKYLRLAAEFDNYRKRTLKEKTEMIRTASEDLIIKFIPFIDDIERGISAVNTAQDLDAVKQGMNLIYTKLIDFLQLNGVREIEVMNQDFNTDLHEAVTTVPVSGEELKGKIVDVIQKGYYLHDKLIRYPKVVIGE